MCYGLKVKGNGPSVVPDGRWGPTPLSLGRLAKLPPSPRLRRTCRRAPATGGLPYYVPHARDFEGSKLAQGGEGRNGVDTACAHQNESRTVLLAKLQHLNGSD